MPTKTERGLPGFLDGSEDWELQLSKDSKSENGAFAVLNPDAVFDLYPTAEDDAGEFYRTSETLVVSVTAIDMAKQTVEFKVFQNFIPGVGLKKMMKASGVYSRAAADLMFLRVEGLTFHGEPVDWEKD